MSFTHSFVALLLVLSLPLTQAPTETSRQPKQYTIEQFLNTTSVSGVSFSADESRILFSSNKTGIWNAYTIPVGGGSWTPITSSTTDSTYGVSFFPTDDRILITRDQGGNELNHLYVRTAAGEERDLTPGDKLKASFMQWSPDGSAFLVQTIQSLSIPSTSPGLQAPGSTISETRAGSPAPMSGAPFGVLAQTSVAKARPSAARQARCEPRQDRVDCAMAVLLQDGLRESHHSEALAATTLDFGAVAGRPATRQTCAAEDSAHRPENPWSRRASFQWSPSP